MLKKNIVLIGMMAAGKTTIGFKLSKKIKISILLILIQKLKNQKMKK